MFSPQVCFNPQGTKVVTASSDKTARLWDPLTGDCRQILEGHTDEIFSCAFNYEGNTLITGENVVFSKVNKLGFNPYLIQFQS